MSQFDMFAEPEAAPAPVAVMDLPPLRPINPDWLDVKVTDAEFDDEMRKHTDASDQYVMLLMLEQRGIRTKPCTDTKLDYLYDYVDGPFVIRKRVAEGFAVTCRQPKQAVVHGS